LEQALELLDRMGLLPGLIDGQNQTAIQELFVDGLRGGG
jgi:hypothetical protein